jgi:hypothetical protein
VKEEGGKRIGEKGRTRGKGIFVRKKEWRKRKAKGERGRRTEREVKKRQGEGLEKKE